MDNIEDLKELEAPATPLFLIDCTLPNGDVERWSTHAVSYESQAYAARLLSHNLFELRAGSQTSAKITLSLANADSHFSEIERESGFRGSRIKIRIVFFDLTAGDAASNTRVVFQGIGNTAD